MIEGKRLLITGAMGFIGQALCRRLVSEGYAIRAVTRRKIPQQSGLDVSIGDWFSVDTIGAKTDWGTALENIDTVIHLAGRVHVSDPGAYALNEYREINVEGTKRLARAAVASGANRFIYLSSVKVHGEETGTGPNGDWARFSESESPRPTGGYAISKWEAEKALGKISKETGLQVTILRPPLVYGPGVQANFLRLLKLVKRGIPIPLATVRNLRSLVYVENLVDAMVVCLSHSSAIRQTFLVSDVDISTPDLIRKIAQALNCPARLLPFPPILLRWAGGVTGRKAVVDRLLGSLVVDSSRFSQGLGWSPPYSLDQGMEATARWLVEKKPRSP